MTETVKWEVATGTSGGTVYYYARLPLPVGAKACGRHIAQNREVPFGPVGPDDHAAARALAQADVDRKNAS